jgi:aspartyl-tRNA(Asn)/glutamyl-tRNA(Gln) amidotransferase subunit C
MASKDEVRAIAKLARLDIPDEQLEQITGEFNQILDYVRLLEKLDLSGIEPMSHVHGVSNVFRDDEVVLELNSKAALQNAPDTAQTFFRVPIIIDPSGEH